MKQEDKDGFHSKGMAYAYDKVCQTIVPAYDFMQEALVDILKFENMDKIIFLDLGAGSGIFIEKVLKEFPESICHYLNSSDDFMHVAKKRLQKYENRVTYIRSDFCES